MVYFGPKAALLHQCHLSGRETAQIQPPTHTLDPKRINVYAEVLHIETRNHHVTSDVHFRKGALTPPFWVGSTGLILSNHHETKHAAAVLRAVSLC